MDELNLDWLKTQSHLGIPLILPWKREAVRLGTCFQSNFIAGDPWLKSTPFILSDLYMIPKVLKSENISTSTFKSFSTTRTTEIGDHLSLGFGIGVGVPFLASASVRGTYDKYVQEDQNSDKSSASASTRGASVELERNPRLNHQAIAVLKYGGGYEKFRNKYGDYFVWGYRLGGDVGILISSSTFSSKKENSYNITAAVDVLLVEVSKKWTKNFHAFSAGKSMNLLGYDTLSNTIWNVSTKADGIEALIKVAGNATLNSQSILERVSEVLETCGLSNGHNLTDEQCQILIGRGIVVELVLLPMTALRDVSRWTTEDNVI